jgi:RNA polymerase sigma factor (sigma-70 family)
MSEHETYRRWIGGERDAGDALVSKHWASVYRYIERRVGAERARDISQETWCEALRTGGYSGAGSFRGWMQAIARTQIRRQNERRAAGLPDRDDGTSPSRSVLRREAVAAVEQLEREGVRQAATAHWVEGRAPREIAGLLGVPEKTVRSRLRIAANQLRERLR